MAINVIDSIKMNGNEYKLNTRICLKRVTEKEFRDILLPKNGYYRVKDVYMNMDTFETVLVYDPNDTVTKYDYVVENEIKKLDELVIDNPFLMG